MSYLSHVPLQRQKMAVEKRAMQAYENIESRQTRRIVLWRPRGQFWTQLFACSRLQAVLLSAVGGCITLTRYLLREDGTGAHSLVGDIGPPGSQPLLLQHSWQMHPAASRRRRCSRWPCPGRWGRSTSVRCSAGTGRSSQNRPCFCSLPSDSTPTRRRQCTSFVRWTGCIKGG